MDSIDRPSESKLNDIGLNAGDNASDIVASGLAASGLGDIGLVDAILLISLALFGVAGFRRGLVREVVDVAGLVIGGTLALRHYREPAAWIAREIGVGSPVSDLAGFVAVFLVATFVISTIGALLIRALSPFVPAFLRPVGSLGGAAVGLAQGVLLIGLVLRAVAILPLDVPVKALIAQSQTADRFGAAFSRILPYVEDATNQLAEDLIPPPPPLHEGESRELNVPRDLTIWADPEAEAEMLRLLNQERQLAGLRSLVADEPLRGVARAHSDEMFRLAYFAHESPVTGTPFDRLRSAGIRYGMAGENLAYAPTVEIAHRGLMNSPDHRRNILTPEFQRVGIGVMKSNLWGRMFSQEFSD